MIRRTVIPVVAVLAATLLVASPAGATISSPSGSRRRICASKTLPVGAGDGRTAIVMDGYDPKPNPDEYEVLARLGTATSLGPAQRLAAGGFLTGVAVGADGTAIAGWEQTINGKQTWRVAIARPGKSFGSARTLGDPGVRTRRSRGDAEGPHRGDLAHPLERSQRAGRDRVARRLVRRREDDRRRPAGSADRRLRPRRDRRRDVARHAAGAAAPARASADRPHRGDPGDDPRVERIRVRGADHARLIHVLGQRAPRSPPGRVASWSPGRSRWRPRAQAGAPAAPRHLRVRALDLTASAPIAGIGLENKLALGLPSDLTISALWQDAKTKNAESDQLTSSVVKTSTRPAAGEHGLFSAAKTLSTSGWLAGGPEAGALTDRTIAAWGETAKTKPSRLRIAIRSNGSWTVASPLKAPDLDTNSVSLAAGSKHVPVVWIQHPDAKRPGGQAYLATYRPS